MSGEGLSLIAPAKVNLVLEILGRREDGYHDLDTVMATIDLADEVRIRPASGLEVALGGETAGIDADGELCAKAAQAMAIAAGREPSVRIEVDKRIPVATGLGGGSTDAAAVIRGLARLWELDWSTERLGEVAAGVGSDEPFFVHGGVARCTGRGEVVEPLRDLRELRMLVIVPPLPPVPGKTAKRFAALHPHDLSDGSRSRRMAHRVTRGAPPPSSDLWNAFEGVIERSESELLAHYGAYASVLGGARLHLAGAGPAVFALVHERAKVTELRREVEALGARVFSARTLPRARALAVEPWGRDQGVEG